VKGRFSDSLLPARRIKKGGARRRKAGMGEQERYSPFPLQISSREKKGEGFLSLRSLVRSCRFNAVGE